MDNGRRVGPNNSLAGRMSRIVDSTGGGVVKNRLRGSAIALALGVAVPVRAADMVVKAPPMAAAQFYNWSGPYVGVNFGAAWTNNSLNLPGNTIYGGLTEFIGGVQAGYNVQIGRLLFGVEGDFDGTTFNHPAMPTPTLGSISQNWIGTMAGRFGITSDRWLVYGRAGGGWAQTNLALSAPGMVGNSSTIGGGWLLGAGLEYGFKSNWTVKLEYDYLALGNLTTAVAPALSVSNAVQTIKAGINYKFVSGGSGGPSGAGAGENTEDLAKQSQNPIANLVSVPFQSNTNFSTGPFSRPQEILNVQPVVPMPLTADWNVISRTIIPLMSQPSPTFDSNTYGIGDITQSLFFSPVNSGALIWGAGPVFTAPSASDPILGTGKVLVGPTAVLLTTPGHWVIGVLLNNQWSVAGNPLRGAVNTFLAQPFVNYNMAGGWYLTTSPILTANWLAASGQQWTVPIGGGFGRVFKIGDQPVNAQIGGYYSVVNPTGAPDWQLRATLALLFPVK
jgi:opacity protein-like surface antigen